MGNLFFVDSVESPEPPLKIARTSKEVASSMPKFELHSEDVWWQSGRRVKMVMDNSVVVGIAVGTTKLLHQATERVFRRVGNIMDEMLQRDWRSQHDGAEYLVWRRRR